MYESAFIPYDDKYSTYMEENGNGVGTPAVLIVSNGKIVSMFGNNFMGKKNAGNKMLQYMMMSEMFKSMNGSGNSNQMSNMLPMMMMFGGNMQNMFSGMFNFFDNDSDDEETEDCEEGGEVPTETEDN